MSDHAVERLCSTAQALGFFAVLCFLGACFVAFVWIMARSIDATLELEDEEGPD